MKRRASEFTELIRNKQGVHCVNKLACGAKVWCPGEKAAKPGEVVLYRCAPAVQYT